MILCFLQGKMYEKCVEFFKILAKFFKRATLQKRITAKQISRMRICAYDGEIKIIKSNLDAKLAVQEILKETVVGFDTESRPAFKKGEYYPPSIVQIACKDKVYIFQLDNTGVVDPIIPIFECPEITKVGAAVSNDVKNLQKLESFEANGFYDLGIFSKILHIPYTGLKNLSAIFLRVRISKSERLTDWKAGSLTEDQVRYAATDAWVSRAIFIKMLEYL